MSAPIVVIGVGHPDRGDDAVGPAVAARLRALHNPPPATILVERGDMAALIDLWSGASLAILVDATRGGGVPGQIVRLDGHAADDALPPFVSSHAFGLAGALALARALGRLPPALVLFGVEGERFEVGSGLSPPVLAAIPRVTDAVVQEVRRRGGG